MEKQLTHVGNFKDWALYRNAQGFIEGYRKIGGNQNETKNGKDLQRVVTQTDDPLKFSYYLRKSPPPRSRTKK